MPDHRAAATASISSEGNGVPAPNLSSNPPIRSRVALRKAKVRLSCSNERPRTKVPLLFRLQGSYVVVLRVKEQNTPTKKTCLSIIVKDLND
jgi:hypothetical protein